MSISHSLSNALSGMTAAARQAEIVSSNVSNSMTDGYGRRSLNLSAANIGGRGAGVEIGSVNRHVDRGILADRRLADAEMGGFDTLVSTMDRVQDVIGTAGEAGSISSRIVAVESALIDATADPSSTIRLSTLSDRLSSLAGGLNSASEGLQSLRVQADASISDQVDRLNTTLSQVERLNSDITRAINTGSDATGLMDERQRVIDTIAEIVPVKELDREGHRVALMTVGGDLILDGPAKEFEFTHNAVITVDMTLTGGGLSGLTFDGAPIATDGIGKLSGGTLGAAFQARDSELTLAQEGLDEVAADLIQRFQSSGVDPTLGAAQAGVFSDSGVFFDAANTTGISGRISLNAAVDPTQGGDVTVLRDGINSTGSGPTGHANLLQAMSAALSDPRGTLGDPTLQSAAGRAATHEATAGSRRLNLESSLSFATARWASLTEAEAADGVDTDHEMQMLLRIEQAYAANARVVQTVETMMQTLMEI